MKLPTPQDFKLKEKKSPTLKDTIFKKAAKVSEKIPSASAVKTTAFNATKKAAEITTAGVKDGLKKSGTKIAGLGVAGAATSAVGTFAATGIGGAIVATGAGAAIVTAGIPLVAGITATCILDKAVDAFTNNDKIDDTQGG